MAGEAFWLGSHGGTSLVARMPSGLDRPMAAETAHLACSNAACCIWALPWNSFVQLQQIRVPITSSLLRSGALDMTLKS